MNVPRISSSRWFIYGSTSLLVFLCLAVLMAALLLMRRSAQPRLGEVSGNSMEPAFLGPRIRVPCDVCGYTNRFSTDAWDDRKPTECQCCDSRLPTPEELQVEPGQRINYLVPRRTQKTLAGGRRTRLVERGDVVVIDHGPNALREIKRVVALPDEPLEILNGDLWVDGHRYEKNVREWLLQAVLVRYWDRSLSDDDWTSCLDTLPFPISNDLPINAHDSHQRVPVNDVGIAIRFARPLNSLNLQASIPQEAKLLDVRLTIGETWDLQATGWGEPISEVFATKETSRSWLVIGVVDRCIVVGDEEQTKISIPLTSTRSSEGVANDPTERLDPELQEWPRLALSTNRDDTIDKILIFRDLHYRGFRDLPSQRYDAAPGYFVLGDNVSISEDSRGTTNDCIRVSSESIRGIVVQPSTSLGSLLRQCDLMRPWPCHTP